MRKNICVAIFLLLLSCAKMPTEESKFSLPLLNVKGLATRAMAGDAQAQYDLGSAYCCGSMRSDEREATKWLCMAARQNHVEAQKKVRWIYSQKAVKKIRQKEEYELISYDNMVALVWYNLALQNGDKLVEPYIREISLYMSWKDAQRADRYIGRYPNIPCEV